jgi:hypothetical protein
LPWAVFFIRDQSYWSITPSVPAIKSRSLGKNLEITILARQSDPPKALQEPVVVATVRDRRAFGCVTIRLITESVDTGARI